MELTIKYIFIQGIIIADNYEKGPFQELFITSKKYYYE